MKNEIKIYALAFFVFIFFGTVTAVYGFGSDTGFVRAVTAVIPLPAGRVGGALVSYRRFFLEQDGIRALLFEEDGVLPPRETVMAQAKESLVRFELLKELADEYGLRIDRHDVSDRYGAILDEKEYPKPAERVLRQMVHALLLADGIKDEIGENKFLELLEAGRRDRVKWFVRF